MKIYGPYYRKDGRQHVIKWDGKTRVTVSYPKFLMEKYLNRRLDTHETVDHINNDFTDNRIENLQILSLSANIKKSAKKEKLSEYKCPNCPVYFIETVSVVRGNLKKNKRGPFCSRRCAGQYSRACQLGRLVELVDTSGLSPDAERRNGSSPLSPSLTLSELMKELGI